MEADPLPEPAQAPENAEVDAEDAAPIRRRSTYRRADFLYTYSEAGGIFFSERIIAPPGLRSYSKRSGVLSEIASSFGFVLKRFEALVDEMFRKYSGVMFSNEFLNITIFPTKIDVHSKSCSKYYTIYAVDSNGKRCIRKYLREIDYLEIYVLLEEILNGGMGAPRKIKFGFDDVDCSVVMDKEIDGIWRRNGPHECIRSLFIDPFPYASDNHAKAYMVYSFQRALRIPSFSIGEFTIKSFMGTIYLEKNNDLYGTVSLIKSKEGELKFRYRSSCDYYECHYEYYSDGTSKSKKFHQVICITELLNFIWHSYVLYHVCKWYCDPVLARYVSGFIARELRYRELQRYRSASEDLSLEYP